MKQSDLCYGFDYQEVLEMCPDDVLERLIEDNTSKAGEDFDKTADNIEWPVTVLEFKRRTVSDRTASSIAESALDIAFENLDSEYGNPDDSGTQPTKEMRDASREFGRLVAEGYVPWQCEKNGNAIKYTREEAKEMFA